MSKFQIGAMEVPDKVIQAFKDRAKANRRSMTKELEMLLIQTAERIEKNKDEELDYDI